MKLGIIGAGWLGTPLCKRMSELGHSVVATKREKEQCEAMNSEGVTVVPYSLSDDHLPEPLIDCDVYIINIALGKKALEPDQVKQEMQRLLKCCLANPESRLLFISSTSVYGEAEREIDEHAETQPLTSSAKLHVEFERFLIEKFQNNTSVLRLAGLVGEDRHPAASFAGKVDVTGAARCVNLIHRTDVIKAIELIIEKQVWGKVMHLCSSEHPSRMEYYKWAAEKMRLDEPMFLDESEQPKSGKTIDASKTLELLGLELSYSSPFDMVVEAKSRLC